MLPKKNRISRIEIDVVLRKGSRYNSQNLILYAYKNSSKLSKFSFSVSKKVCKTAVSRNKYRRRGYSVIARKISLIMHGFLCLFVFKKGSGSIKYENLEKEILELLYESNVFCPHNK